MSLFHNPDAGSSDHSQKELRARIEDGGFSVIFSTTDAADMKNAIPDMTDFVVIAGGDGMVRKVVDQMLNRRIADGQFPIAIIPLGTANNIARTLCLPIDTQEVIVGWKKGITKPVDVARLNGLKSASFFIEGLGYGLLPTMINEMKQKENKSDDPQTALNNALHRLHEVAKTIKPQMCSISVDDQTFKGDVLMVEVMNMKTVGPNLLFSPTADPSDGRLEVVYVTADERRSLTDFSESKLDGSEKPLNCHVLRGSRVEIVSESDLVHVDDKLYESKKDGVSIALRPGLLEFLV